VASGRRTRPNQRVLSATDPAAGSVPEVRHPWRRGGLAVCRQFEQVDLLLLSHDHVLEQMLERLAARLLARMRDHLVQRRHRCPFVIHELRQSPTRVSGQVDMTRFYPEVATESGQLLG
jgi:hypothetical protein